LRQIEGFALECDVGELRGWCQGLELRKPLQRKKSEFGAGGWRRFQ